MPKTPNSAARQTLYRALLDVDRGLANEVWWWSEGGSLVRRCYPRYYQAIMTPKKNVPVLLSDPDPAVQTIAKWRCTQINKEG